MTVNKPFFTIESLESAIVLFAFLAGSFSVIGALTQLQLDNNIRTNVDVQAMGFACIEAGYDSYSTEAKGCLTKYPIECYYTQVAQHYSINFNTNQHLLNSCLEIESKINNRVVLENGKYVVQTKQPVEEWVTIKVKQ